VRSGPFSETWTQSRSQLLPVATVRSLRCSVGYVTKISTSDSDLQVGLITPRGPPVEVVKNCMYRYFITPSPVNEGSIVMSVSVCVCLFIRQFVSLPADIFLGTIHAKSKLHQITHIACL